MAESNGLQEFSPEQRRLHGPTIDQACRNAGVANGDSILVVWDDQIYHYRYEGDADPQTEGRSIPNCPTELCNRVRAQIDRLCHDNAWPPDHPVLIAQPDGQMCYCYCC